jgi:hypothetical protein
MALDQVKLLNTRFLDTFYTLKHFWKHRSCQDTKVT